MWYITMILCAPNVNLCDVITEMWYFSVLRDICRSVKGNSIVTLLSGLIEVDIDYLEGYFSVGMFYPDGVVVV